jgi:hypothetical protein
MSESGKFVSPISLKVGAKHDALACLCVCVRVGLFRCGVERVGCGVQVGWGGEQVGWGGECADVWVVPFLAQILLGFPSPGMLRRSGFLGSLGDCCSAAVFAPAFDRLVRRFCIEIGLLKIVAPQHSSHRRLFALCGAFAARFWAPVAARSEPALCDVNQAFGLLSFRRRLLGRVLRQLPPRVLFSAV